MFVMILTVFAHFLSLSHPFPLVPCLKYFLANSTISYLLSCSTLSSSSPSLNPSKETFWKSKIHTEKQCETQMSAKNKIHVWACLYLNGLIYLVCSHCGRHSNSDSRWRRKPSGSSSRFCFAVQWQWQEIRRSDGTDTIGWECSRATEHGTKLPTWHTRNRKTTTITKPVTQKHQFWFL